MAKVIKLFKEGKPNSVEVLELIVSQLNKDEITDFIVIARRKLPEPLPDQKYEVHKYWFGEDGCCVMLGLLEYMKLDIGEYIHDRQELYEG